MTAHFILQQHKTLSSHSDRHRNLINRTLGNASSLQIIWSKSIHKKRPCYCKHIYWKSHLSNITNRQTDRQTGKQKDYYKNITFFLFCLVSHHKALKRVQTITLKLLIHGKKLTCLRKTASSPYSRAQKLLSQAYSKSYKKWSKSPWKQSGGYQQNTVESICGISKFWNCCSLWFKFQLRYTDCGVDRN